MSKVPNHRIVRPYVVGGGDHIILGWIRDFLSPKVQVSSTDHVQELKAPRPRYKAQWIPLQFHAWFFEAFSMALDSLMVYLWPKAWSSLLEHHSWGPNTPTYFSNTHDGVNILNHMTITLLRGHVWLVEVIFQSLDGYNIPLGIEVQLSSLYHVQGPKAPKHGYMVAWISM